MAASLLGGDSASCVCWKRAVVTGIAAVEFEQLRLACSPVAWMAS